MTGARTSTGNVERNAAGGAAAGAAAGRVAGAVRGYSLDQRQAECRNSPRSETFRDSTGRPCYFVLGTDRTCWSSSQTPSGL